MAPLPSSLTLSGRRRQWRVESRLHAALICSCCLNNISFINSRCWVLKFWHDIISAGLKIRSILASGSGSDKFNTHLQTKSGCNDWLSHKSVFYLRYLNNESLHSVKKKVWDRSWLISTVSATELAKITELYVHNRSVNILILHNTCPSSMGSIPGTRHILIINQHKICCSSRWSVLHDVATYLSSLTMTNLLRGVRGRLGGGGGGGHSNVWQRHNTAPAKVI